MQDCQLNGRCNFAIPVSPCVCPPRSLPANEVSVLRLLVSSPLPYHRYFTPIGAYTPSVIILKPPLLPVLGLNQSKQRMHVVFSNSYVPTLCSCSGKIPTSRPLVSRAGSTSTLNYVSQPHSFGRISRRCSTSFLLEHFPLWYNYLKWRVSKYSPTSHTSTLLKMDL